MKWMILTAALMAPVAADAATMTFVNLPGYLDDYGYSYEEGGIRAVGTMAHRGFAMNQGALYMADNGTGFGTGAEFYLNSGFNRVALDWRFYNDTLPPTPFGDLDLRAWDAAGNDVWTGSLVYGAQDVWTSPDFAEAVGFSIYMVDMGCGMPCVDMELDRIDLVAAPVPGALGMLGAAVAAAGMFMRRRI